MSGTQGTPTAPVSSLRVRGHGGNPPGQGPFMSVELVIEGERVLSAIYETYQCPTCHECGKAIAGLATGRTLSDARDIKWEHLVARVGEVPRGKRQCLSLALLALSSALDQLKKRE